MAFAQADIDALKAALASGVTEVRHADGRQVRYRSLAEIRDIISMAGRDVAPVAPRSFVAGF